MPLPGHVTPSSVFLQDNVMPVPGQVRPNSLFLENNAMPVPGQVTPSSLFLQDNAMSVPGQVTPSSSFLQDNAMSVISKILAFFPTDENFGGRAKVNFPFLELASYIWCLLYLLYVLVAATLA